jgi:hypothetical protein
MRSLDAFNNAHVDGLTLLYDEDAINHQVAETPVEMAGPTRAQGLRLLPRSGRWREAFWW